MGISRRRRSLGHGRETVPQREVRAKYTLPSRHRPTSGPVFLRPMPPRVASAGDSSGRVEHNGTRGPRSEWLVGFSARGAWGSWPGVPPSRVTRGRPRQGGIPMDRRVLIALLAGVFGVWLGAASPARAQQYNLDRHFYYPYYYFPHNYWPTQG